MTLKFKKIYDRGGIYALVLRKGAEAKGVNFITPRNYPLQVGVQLRRKNELIKSHIHKSTKKEIKTIQEFIHIDYGRVKVSIFNENGEKISDIILNSGDSMLQVRGGHGFKVLKDTKLIEVKQGPYDSVKEDKIKF